MPSPQSTDLAPRFNNLADWLAWQEVLHPKVIDLGLERVRQVAMRLDAQLGGGLFHPLGKTVLIAGTNGKGSCVAAMAAILRKQGLAVGSFTSPHLLRYNERISINGLEACDQALCDAFTAIDRARGDISLSYFEFGTLAAFWIMARANLDVWLVEVGLGGRLDATNILDADIAVITSIALDHEAYLGDTRALIASEKLGIARADRLLICAEPDPPDTLISGVAALGCAVLWGGRDFSWFVEGRSVRFVVNAQRAIVVPSPQLPPPSIAAALIACDSLGYLPDSQDWSSVLSGARLMGRWQRMTCDGVEILLDVAHNPASTQALADYLAQSVQPFVLVMGMMADKNIPASLSPLNQAQHCYAVDLPITRAASANELAEHAGRLGLAASAHTSVAAALQAALVDCRETQARLVVCGSFYTLAAAYPELTRLGALEVVNG